MALVIFTQIDTCYNSELKALKQEEFLLKTRLAADTLNTIVCCV